MEHPLDVTYGLISGWIFLVILGSISVGFFIFQVQKATRLVLLGSTDNRFDSWSARIKETLVVWLGQKKVLEDKIGNTGG